jgi:hypothetical protein
MNLEALLAFLFFSWIMFGRQCLFLPFGGVFFTFSAISWQFPTLTAKKFSFSLNTCRLIAFLASST